MSAFPERPIPMASIYDIARELIARGEVDAITSDVFDTIVSRDCASPADVFTDVAHRLQERGLLDDALRADTFRRCRVDAETTARQRLVDERRGSEFTRAAPDREPAPECTIDEIWGVVESMSGVEAAAGRDLELTVESARLHPLPNAVAFLQYAAASGVPVHLVSDTYLSAVELENLLATVGIPTTAFASVTTSSDHRLSKLDGLLAQVIEQHGLDASRVLHIGDNPESDVAAATAAGAHALEADLGESLTVVSRGGSAVEAWSQRTGTDLGLTSVLRQQLLQAGDVSCFPAYQFGAAALGPPLFGFARWAVDTVESLGGAPIHGLLREGQTLVELIRSANEGRTLPDLRLVHASRWVDVRAACLEASTDEIEEMLSRRDPLSAADVALTLGCQLEPIEQLVGQQPVQPAEVRQLAAAIHRDDDLRESIVEASRLLRERVVAQLHIELDLDADRLVLIDVGWGGRIQASIEKILRTSGYTQPITGLYLALSQTGESRVATGADMRAYLPHRFDTDMTGEVSRDIAHHADTIERVLTPNISTFIDVEDDGTPVRAVAAESRPPGVDLARQGLFDMVEALAARAVDDRWVNDPTWRESVAIPLRECVLTPHPLLARDLTSWSHDDVGGDRETPLGGGNSTVERVRLASARDLDTLVDQRTTWVDGVAAEHHPTLLAQRYAIRQGLGIDQASPPSPGGVVRLSVFGHGSDAPVAQQLHEIGTTGSGWNAITLGFDERPIRAVRFDPGELELFVEFATTRIQAVGIDQPTFEFETAGLADRKWAFVNARLIDPRRAAFHRGGHVLLPLPGQGGLGDHSRRVEVMIVFRRWRLDAGDPLLTEPPTERVRRVATTSARRAQRLIGRLRSTDDLDS